MIQIIIKNHTDSSTIAAQYNSKLSDVLLKSKENFPMPCGGKGRCGKCKIQTTDLAHRGEIKNLSDSATELISVSGLLSVQAKAELEQLSPKEIAQGIRLACCTNIMGNLDIETNFDKNEVVQIETDLPFIGEPKDISYNNYGIVVDIGTTTMVLKLLSKTEIIDTDSMLNPQVRFGSDVISRMEASLAGNGATLQEQVLSAINEMIKKVSANSNVASAMIDYAVITGNTTMMFLLLNYSVKSIATAPFCADELFGKQYSTKEIALNISPKATIEIPFCISAFVGADITTAIAYCNFYESSKTALMIDIGTNGEIALWHNHKLSVASTAAGPAFEGAGIYMGMNGKIGAIDNMFIENGEIKYSVIGSVLPKGLCGSGIISAIATMIEAEIIDETGEIVFDNEKYKQYETEFDEHPAFQIDQIIITQKDIRMVQLAKSALFAGIKTLISIENITFEQIDVFYIAGGFGKYINIEDAIKIGLIPKEVLKKTKVVGNASLGGGVMLAFDKKLKKTLEKIAREAVVADLAGSKIFSEAYIDGMMFE